jgi:hypothetical protein
MKKQFIISILLTNLFSQSFTDLTPRLSYDINKIDTPITIDGQLDEESWGLAQIATGFTGTNVFQGEPAAFKTEAKLLYDDSNLYVAFIAYTPPEKIRTSLSKRDNLNDDDDWVVIELDLFGDESLIYGIGANPSGVQIDGRSGYRFDTSLDLIFDVKTSTTDYGYIVEFAIPFSSLRYSVGKKQDWRLNFGRSYTTDDELPHSVFWASQIQGIECQTCQMAFLKGIEPPKQKADNIEYIPSLVAGYSEDFNNDSTSDNLEPSLFIKYPISSVDLLEIAINPDFSQIESDDIQNDINTVNALRFRERRPFFSEGAELFKFHSERGYINLFYSRTINDPSVAVKYTGKIGKTSYGVISAIDESSPLLLPFEESSTIVQMGESTSNIVRVKRMLKNASSIGAIITNRTFDKGGDMTTGGIDFHYHPGKNLHLTLHATASIHNEPDSLSTIFDDNPYTFDNHTAKFDGEEITGNALGFGLSKMTRTDVTGLTVRLRSPGFRTSNGFEKNNSTKWMQLSKGKQIFYDNHPRLLTSGHKIQMVYKTNYDGDIKEQEFEFNNEFVFLNGYALQIGTDSENELFRGVQFDNMFGMNISVTGKLNAKTKIHGGIAGGDTIIRYLDTPEQTDAYGIWSYVEYKISDQASTGIGIQYEDAKDYYDGFLLNSWYTHSFTSKLSLRTKIQYSDFSHSWFIEPLLTYQPNAFSALYVGINDLLTTDDNMFSNLKESERQFFIKFQYLL